MATTMLCPSWSVLRLQSNIITNEQTTQLAKRPICPRPPERLGALVSAFLSAAPLLTRSNIHRRDSLPAVSCNAGFCNAPEARCPTSTMLMALQKPHRSANGAADEGSSDEAMQIHRASRRRAASRRCPAHYRVLRPRHRPLDHQHPNALLSHRGGGGRGGR